MYTIKIQCVAFTNHSLNSKDKNKIKLYKSKAVANIFVYNIVRPRLKISRAPRKQHQKNKILSQTEPFSTKICNLFYENKKRGRRKNATKWMKYFA